MIHIENVSHHIGKQTILNNIRLEIPAGGITALIGPNGAGKSTLLSLMARLQPQKVVFLGDVPTGCTGNIEHHETYYRTVNSRRKT